jgi:hypothetical protein
MAKIPKRARCTGGQQVAQSGKTPKRDGTAAARDATTAQTALANRTALSAAARLYRRRIFRYISMRRILMLFTLEGVLMLTANPA